MENLHPNINRINADDLKRLIDFAYLAHQKHNTRKDYRQDWTVPYFMHPLWCAMILIGDPRIPFEERKLGYQALLLHDVLEDTELSLPDNLDPRVLKLVEGMTHDSWEEERSHKLNTRLARLLKLCDKVATVYDESMRKDVQKWREWLSYSRELLSQVEKDYPKSKIVIVAKAILDTPIERVDL